ncbi:hypothetical protein [Lentilactobacillus kisonensis]|uniref:hypothetical protein n=1 Tax=Lentilactobacillus kisonensis TaxID=481722 RepID=UPI001FB52C98|nr:hypothetical protein [Lentilactobacillus kisonensis]
MKTVLILGAAGQISSYLIPALLQQTDFNLKLYARNANNRIKVTDLSEKPLLMAILTTSSHLMWLWTGLMLFI